MGRRRGSPACQPDSEGQLPTVHLRCDDGHAGGVTRAVPAAAVRRWLLAGAVMAMLPVVVAAVRGVRRGWIPTWDRAYPALRAWDVFTPLAWRTPRAVAVYLNDARRPA